MFKKLPRYQIFLRTIPQIELSSNHPFSLELFYCYFLRKISTKYQQKKKRIKPTVAMSFVFFSIFLVYFGIMSNVLIL